jgi:hypothetical protein
MITDTTAEECMHYIDSRIHISRSDLVIDPCAINKHFIDLIKNKPCTSLFYNSDFTQTSNTIQHFDFLTVDDYNKFDRTVLSGLWYDDVHIIGSPPDHTAIAFIKKCCEFADSISFILPFGLDDYFSAEYRLLFSTELPQLSRSSHIKDRKVFQIWTKGAGEIP